MKKTILYFSFFLLLFSKISYGQISLIKADAIQPQINDGVIYTLPLTVLKIEFDIIETKKIPGPFKDLSKDFLGVNEVISEESSEYEAINIKTSTLTIPDNENAYFVSFNTEKTKDKEMKPPVITLTPEGFIRSIYTTPQSPPPGKTPMIKSEEKVFILGEEADKFQYESDFNKKIKIDTIVRKITIDTMTINKFIFKTTWVNKTPEQRAEEAAAFIKKIRESRFNLLTGYHEVNFSGSIEYMDYQLEKLEQQYLELFLGKELKKVTHYTLFFAPNDNILQKELFKSPEGDQLIVKISLLNKSDVKEAKAPLENALIYRIPALCDVKILYNRKNLFNDIYGISQLGVKSSITVNKTSVVFNPHTGLPEVVKKF
jgi:hypothetical protein